MERAFTFFLGCITAGLVGFVVSLSVKFWHSVIKGRKQNSIGNQDRNSDQEVPPIWPGAPILAEGCWRVITLALFLLVFLVSLCIIVVILQENLLPDYFVGVIFAFVFGFYLQSTRFNWKKIIQLYQIFINWFHSEFEAIKPKIKKIFVNLQNIDTFKDDLMGSAYTSSKIPSTSDDLKKQIIMKSRRLQKLKEQQALYGISVDPRILIEIEDIEIQLKELKSELQSLDVEEHSLDS